MTDITQWIDAAEARCAKAESIPIDAHADWDGTNHYEIQSGGSEFWWLICRDVFEFKGDPSATEAGKRLGMVLDFACAARTDLPRALAALRDLVSRVDWAKSETTNETTIAQLEEALGEVQAILEGRDDNR